MLVLQLLPPSQVISSSAHQAKGGGLENLYNGFKSFEWTKTLKGECGLNPWAKARVLMSTCVSSRNYFLIC